MKLFSCCFKAKPPQTTFKDSPYFGETEKQDALTFYASYNMDTQPISLDGVKSWCRVVDVYDGDSLTVVMPYKDKQHVFKFAIRLAGIDACEMNSKLLENKIKATLARDRVIQLVTGKSIIPVFRTRKDVQTYLNKDVYLVWIHCYGMDKYKRILADVYVGNETISLVLVREKLAYVYDGRTKLGEDAQRKALPLVAQD
jgi:endonuclease YncB( thermonuclease family)